MKKYNQIRIFRGHAPRKIHLCGSGVPFSFKTARDANARTAQPHQKHLVFDVNA